MNIQENLELTVAIVTVAGSILAALISREGLFRWKRKADIDFKLVNIYAPLNYEIIRLKASNFSSSESSRFVEKADEILSKYSHLVPTELIHSYAKMISDIDLKTSPSFHDFCYVVTHQYGQCQNLINSNKPYFNKTKALKNVLVGSFWFSVIIVVFLLVVAFIWREENTFLSNPCFILILISLAFLSTFVSQFLERSDRSARSLSLPSNKDSSQSS